MISYILTDIEGTTTPIDFVHKTLFPYSAQHLPSYVEEQQNHNPKVQQALDHVCKTVVEEEGRSIDRQQAIDVLLQWIKDDRKHPALKELQGMVWEAGYREGSFATELYPDVADHLRIWKREGRQLGIYSSGSVAAQKLLFAHTPDGDLTPLFSNFFDTAVGAKREISSYSNILHKLRISGHNVLFLSDIEAELDAAKKAGLHTLQLVRPGTISGTRHPHVSDFAGVQEWLIAL